MNVQQEVEACIAQFEQELKEHVRQNGDKALRPFIPVEARLYEKVDACVIQLQNIFFEWYTARAKAGPVPLADEADGVMWEEHLSSLRMHEAGWRLLSLTHGAYVSQSQFGLVLDVPGQVWYHAQAIANLARAYGFSVQSPLESFYAIRLMYIGYLPKSSQWREWMVLQSELDEHEQGHLLYRAEKSFSREDMLQALSLQLLKTGLFTRGKRKRWLALATCGVINYRYAKNVIALAKTFYQKRWLMRQAERDQ